MTAQLAGRIALITGANRGIGLAIARTYAREGAQCILAGRNMDALERVAAEINAAGGTASALPLDLESVESIRAAIDKLAATLPRLDVFVANGALLGARVEITKYPLDVWKQTFQANVHANLQLLQGLDPLLRKSDAGRVILLSTGVARTPRARSGSYAVSKAALGAMADIYALECAGSAIRVNVVSPGATRTKMRAQVAPDEDPMTLKTPEDIAPLFVELALPSNQRQGELVNADAWLKAREGTKQ
jgi:NAD(P)-dependent dehydrogenase (short-subunit alcohol dehydrogenase family)